MKQEIDRKGRNLSERDRRKAGELYGYGSATAKEMLLESNHAFPLEHCQVAANQHEQAEKEAQVLAAIADRSILNQHTRKLTILLV